MQKYIIYSTQIRQEFSPEILNLKNLKGPYFGLLRGLMSILKHPVGLDVGSGDPFRGLKTGYI